MSFLAIQLIQLHYTDAQRSADYARKREQLRALPLPPLAGDGVLHDCRAFAWSGFEPWTMTSGVPMRGDGIDLSFGLQLRREPDRLVFVGRGSRLSWRSKPLFATAIDTWGRLLWNAKTGDGDHKWLVQCVANAGCFSAPPAGSVFLGTPTIERDVRHDYLRNGYVAA